MLFAQQNITRERLKMPLASRLTQEERSEIEELIKNFDNHGCGFGYDLQAQEALRRLLDILDEAEQVIEKYESAC